MNIVIRNYCVGINNKMHGFELFLWQDKEVIMFFRLSWMYNTYVVTDNKGYYEQEKYWF